MLLDLVLILLFGAGVYRTERPGASWHLFVIVAVFVAVVAAVWVFMGAPPAQQPSTQ